MKIFLTLLFVGFASAVLKKKLQDETKNFVVAFVNGLDTAAPLYIELGVEESKDIQRFERNIKTELKKHVEDAFEKVFAKIEDTLTNNDEKNEKILEMMKDLRQKREDLDKYSNEITEEMKTLKSNLNDHLKTVLKKMEVLGKSSTDPELPEIMQGVLGDISIKDMLSKLKNWVLEKLDVKTMRDAFVKIIGQASEKLCKWVTTKGQEKVIDFFDNFLDTGKKKRTSEDSFLEFRDYLKKMDANIEEKLMKFKNWLHTIIDNGIYEAKKKFQSFTEILKEIIGNRKHVTMKSLVDMLEHIRGFEDKFDSLYDIRNLIEDFLKKEE